MTRQENILTLNEHLDHWKRLLSEKICDQDEGEKTIDALQNAIKALEQEQCEDCISRQAVDDAIYDYSRSCDVNYAQIMEFIDKLPSVTAQPCEDCVSRQVVIDCFKKWQPYMATRLFDFEKELSALPSVTPQPEIWHWIEHIHNGMHYIECPKCSSWFLRMYLTRNSYCPNCGAKMQEVEE